MDEMIMDRPRGKSGHKIKKITKETSRGVIHNLPNVVVNQSQQILPNKIKLKSLS